MKRLILALFAVASIFALASCEQDPFGRSVFEIRKEQKACIAEGGNWTSGGITGAEMCFRPMEDAGKVCTKASDCMGDCLVGETGRGQCSSVSPLFGCYTYLDSDGQKVEICVD